MRLILILFVTLFLRTIAVAAPPLTEDIHRDFQAAVYDALGIPRKGYIDTALRQWRVDAWQQQNTGEIEGTLFIVKSWRDIQRMPEPQRTGAQALLRISMVQTFRQNAATDPVVQTLVALYDQAHPALAPGNPPLTRESANAWVDLILLAKTGGFEISSADREQGIRMIAQQYGQADSPRQLLVFQSIYFVAKLKAEWPTMSVQARQDWRATLRNIFEPQAADGQVQHMLNQHSFRMMQNQLNFMKQNTDTIMGSPPYFDPSCNCYKQRGGIVTEFH
jgi:hypothetical protein